ncbi:4-hydroxy-tetrahydrodipicolinate synthase [Kordiimonas sediminis]|uniref:4-hydroxy-tetrahydrodipicolinate synthase n=1 Tax=Kordiimonas sediminis TaxID=1735581 RepID=A0A919EAA5_9PROT|nr:4-hydroxy-tetrahydrodipicolinate synthase [Kordiimonas sediminis]GHF29753.1 4-hydroxy-tetrahydrodipicolinate synthase [Kordiimonas sediminis]
MFKGSIPALITPFDAQGEVDKDLYQKFVDWQVKQGSHGLVPVGTTGESPTLSHEEHHLVVDLCVEAADGRVPVMAGTGSNSTREAITLTQHAERAGVTAALVVTPYYNKPSQEGLYQHFKAIHDETNLPIYIYNIPGRSIVDMTVETMARLFELPRIVGVKDATGDLSRVSDQRTLVGEDFIQLSGDDPTTLGFMAMGGHGAISVTANVAPALCSKFQEACMNGQYDVALGYQDKLIALHHAMFIEPSPAPAKFALSCLGIGNDYVRRPLVPLTEAGRTRIRNVLAELSLDTVSF